MVVRVAASWPDSITLIASPDPTIAVASIFTSSVDFRSIIELMDRSARRIPPKSLVNAYIEAGGTGNVADQDALWKTFGKKTVATMADGARVLARIWQAAWDEGSGDLIGGGAGAIDPKDLKNMYEDTTFVESINLNDIESVLK